jgi:hypothetical protein
LRLIKFPEIESTCSSTTPQNSSLRKIKQNIFTGRQKAKNYNRIYVKRVLMNSTQLMKAIINVNKKIMEANSELRDFA